MKKLSIIDMYLAINETQTQDMVLFKVRVHRYVVLISADNTLDIIIVCRATVSYLHATG